MCIRDSDDTDDVSQQLIFLRRQFRLTEDTSFWTDLSLVCFHSENNFVYENRSSVHYIHCPMNVVGSLVAELDVNSVTEPKRRYY